MNRVLSRVLAVVTGVAVGGGTYAWLVADPVFTGTMGIVYAAAVWLTIAFGSELPGAIHGDDWQTIRWNGAFAVLVLVVAPLGVSTTLPLSSDLRLALQLLVIGVGYTGLLFGVAMTRAKMAAADSPEGEATETGTGHATPSDTKSL